MQLMAYGMTTTEAFASGVTGESRRYVLVAPGVAKVLAPARNKVQTLAGGAGVELKEIKLPSRWNERMAKLGRPPLDEFYLKASATSDAKTAEKPKVVSKTDEKPEVTVAKTDEKPKASVA